ncbi:MAG: hypothetical protein KF760_30390 [Candidatus Eremiobacteraeota bacterium]|nr:hypothetical protein [Candidatus Eremiobacteraeota bacterium]MCW5868110.1 hypothetical protein [Candidatus Eremiobacteraeota bacterium]
MKKIVFAISLVALTLAGWAQPKPERDPFVNLAQKNSGVVTEDEITPRVHTKTPVKIIPTAPKLNVLGLVTNSRQPKAIVAGEKSTFIVAQGDKLGDYRVAKIDRSGVTLAFKQNRYQFPLAKTS